MKLALLGLTAFLFSNVAALAADNHYNWSGPYVGGSIGWVSTNQENNALPYGGPLWSASVNSIYLGGLAGFNEQINHAVIGLEGDFGATLGSGTDTDLTPFTFPGLVSHNNNQYLGTVRGRLGFAKDNVLFYATGGLGVLGAEFDFNGFATTSNSFHSHLGWVAGAGIDYGVKQNLILRAEYLHGAFGSIFYSDAGGSAGDMKPTVDLVRASVIYKF